jgi:hypothetical protein
MSKEGAATECRPYNVVPRHPRWTLHKVRVNLPRHLILAVAVS